MGRVSILSFCAIGVALAYAQTSSWRARVAELKSRGDAAGALAIVQKEPASPETEDEIGFLLAVLGRKDEALGHFESALSLQPRYAPAAFHLGVALWLKSPSGQALQYLRQA